ncbi:MAG: lipid A biosynthesis acyltransferase, partial [candidate division Zixibacteria bacterium]|nr:lipid A biosynthesis acyltransferase [candidate division Zixibacteria bacterium]
MLLRRERYDRHVVMAGPAIYPPNSGDEEKDIVFMTEAYTRFFEECIRKYPDQWLWTHRRWKLD